MVAKPAYVEIVAAAACTLCSKLFNSVDLLHEHLQCQHGVALTIEQTRIAEETFTRLSKHTGCTDDSDYEQTSRSEPVYSCTNAAVSSSASLENANFDTLNCDNKHVSCDDPEKWSVFVTSEKFPGNYSAKGTKTVEHCSGVKASFDTFNYNAARGQFSQNSQNINKDDFFSSKMRGDISEVFDRISEMIEIVDETTCIATNDINGDYSDRIQSNQAITTNSLPPVASEQATSQSNALDPMQSQQETQQSQSKPVALKPLLPLQVEFPVEDDTFTFIKSGQECFPLQKEKDTRSIEIEMVTTGKVFNQEANAERFSRFPKLVLEKLPTEALHGRVITTDSNMTSVSQKRANTGPNKGSRRIENYSTFLPPENRNVSNAVEIGEFSTKPTEINTEVKTKDFGIGGNVTYSSEDLNLNDISFGEQNEEKPPKDVPNLNRGDMQCGKKQNSTIKTTRLRHPAQSKALIDHSDLDTDSDKESFGMEEKALTTSHSIVEPFQSQNEFAEGQTINPACDIPVGQLTKTLIAPEKTFLVKSAAKKTNFVDSIVDAHLTAVNVMKDDSMCEKNTARKVKCVHCLVKFVDMQTFSKHMKIHMVESPMYECKYCTKQFAHATHRQSHMKYCRVNDLVSKGEITKKVGQQIKQALNNSTLIVPHFLKCSRCEKTYYTKLSLERHMERKHTTKTDPNLPIDGNIEVSSFEPKKTTMQQSNSRSRINMDEQKSNFDKKKTIQKPHKNPRNFGLPIDDIKSEHSEKRATKPLNSSVSTPTLDELDDSNQKEIKHTYTSLVSNDSLTEPDDAETKPGKTKLKQNDRGDPKVEERQTPELYTSKDVDADKLNGVVTEDNSFACQTCKTVFQNKSAVMAHFRRNHADAFEHRCACCEKLFTTRQLYREHMIYTHRKPPGFDRERISLKGIVNKPMAAVIELTDPGDIKAMMRTQEQHASLQNKCSFCWDQINDTVELAKHVEEHIKKCDRFRCKWCDREYSKLENRIYHHNLCEIAQLVSEGLISAQRGDDIKEIFSSNQAGTFKKNCLQCDITFTDKKKFSVHHKEHLKEKNVKCRLCDKIYITYESFLRHLQRKHEPASYKCSVCEKPCGNKQILQKHEASHKPGTLPCSYCGKMHKTKENLNRHEAIHKPATLPCSYCGKMHKTKEHLNRHEAIHKPATLPCSYCGKMYKTKELLNRHVRFVHEGGAGSCECQVCGKRLNTKSSLQAHMRLHEAPDDRPFQCTKCPYRTRTKQNLKVHEIVHKTELEFMCSVEHCKKLFKSKVLLKNHQITHQDIRRFSCDLCGERFKHATHLRYHKLKHSGEKPFICHVCGKGFGRKQIMQTHLLTHSAEKAFRCEICDKVFVRKTDLNKHNRLEHASDG